MRAHHSVAAERHTMIYDLGMRHVMDSMTNVNISSVEMGYSSDFLDRHQGVHGVKYYCLIGTSYASKARVTFRASSLELVTSQSTFAKHASGRLSKMLPATIRAAQKLQVPSKSYLFPGRSMTSSTRPSQLLWMRQEAEMQMLEEERRREEEEQRRKEVKEAELEHEQSTVDSSIILVPKPSAKSDRLSAEDANNEGQPCCQVGGGKDVIAIAPSQKGTAPSVPRSICG